MRNRLLIPSTIFVILFVLSCFPVAVQAQFPPTTGEPTREEVVSFASDITVREDGRITVVEKIDYFFPTPKHGIYRDIPIRYELDDGRTVVVPVEVKSVIGASYSVIRNRNAVRLKIGDPDATVTGLQRYEITYEASGALRYFDDHDELYWNVTGHDWDVPFRRVSAVVHLPEGAVEEDIRLKCFMGAYGDTGLECLYNRSGTTAHFVADDFLTIVVGWTPGLVARLEPMEAGFMTDVVNPTLPVLPFAVLIPIIAFIYLLRKWMRVGRDPEGSGALVARYSPPEGLTPAEVGVLIDEKAHMKDISATIVDLAVRGYIRINDEKSGGLSFRKNFGFKLLRLQYKDDAELKPHEVKVLSVMFGGENYVTLEKLIKTHAFHGNLKLINKRLYGQTVAKGYFARSPRSVRSKYAGTGSLFIAVSGVAFIFLAQTAALSFGNLKYVVLAGGGVVTGLLFLIFAPFMPRKTNEGMKAFEHSKGFKEYLLTAEKYRLEWQEKEKMFERFLPYAMVFDVVDQWSDAFKDLDMQSPNWYEGEAIVQNRFHVGRFMASMDSLESGLGRAMKSAPSKSSSGSGFSSGGGFGGGGGGSW
ncbi:MAG: DUF2207 domain-containing protein [Patescibacteria group bacterium]|nr:DUF2207 domain-containing protein [Patescibacteria group bacterium]